MRSGKLAWLCVCLSIIASLAVGCGSPTATPVQTPLPTAILTLNATPVPASTPAPASNPASPVTSPIPSVDNWPTYHRDLSRTGFDPGVSPDGSTHRLWTSDSLDGDIYTEPLVVGEKVLVVTEQNSVYSLDIQTGKVLWQKNLGTPVPRADLSCGNIDPSGITSTPVADPITGRLYVVARIQPDHHELFALDIQTGAVVSHRTVDPPGTYPRVQQQRSALALSNGKVYVAFGGLYGDCGSFNGWLVGVPVDGNGPLVSYRVPSQRGSGLWAPSGPAFDGTGNIYVTSGNGFSNSSFDFGNSVIRLSPDLAVVDWFAPANWQELNTGDIDLGSMGPTLLQGGLIFQAGKEGKGYLLPADSMGHIGGEVFSGSIGQGAYGGTDMHHPTSLSPAPTDWLPCASTPALHLKWHGPALVSLRPSSRGRRDRFDSGYWQWHPIRTYRRQR